MARPPKNPSDRKTIHLRVPITAAQKKIVDDAMAVDGREFAGWARDLILDSAKAILDARSAPKKQRAAKSRMPP
jgi:hypothetical protein